MNDADTVFVLPVYEAGETPIDGYNATALADGLRAHGHRNALAVPQDDALAAMLAAEVQADDVVICMGAGSISTLAYALPQQIEEARA